MLQRILRPQSSIIMYTHLLSKNTRVLAIVGNNNKLLGCFSNHLFLKMSTASALDRIQLRVYFISTIDRDVNVGVPKSKSQFRSAKVSSGTDPAFAAIPSRSCHLLFNVPDCQSSVEQQAARLEGGWDKHRLGVQLGTTLDQTIDNMNNSGARTDADNPMCG